MANMKTAKQLHLQSIIWPLPCSVFRESKFGKFLTRLASLLKGEETATRVENEDSRMATIETAGSLGFELQ